MTRNNSRAGDEPAALRASLQAHDHRRLHAGSPRGGGSDELDVAVFQTDAFRIK